MSERHITVSVAGVIGPAARSTTTTLPGRWGSGGDGELGLDHILDVVAPCLHRLALLIRVFGEVVVLLRTGLCHTADVVRAGLGDVQGDLELGLSNVLERAAEVMQAVV